jgi:N6-adenosine-specific RNA methylase IME4
MLMMRTPRPLVVAASALLTRWGWDPLRTISMVWPKMQANHPDKLWMGTGKRLRDQHESIIIAVRGVPPALPMWGSVLIAPVGEPSEKPKLLMEMIDRDYGPEASSRHSACRSTSQREPGSCAEPSGTNAKWIAEVCG